MGPPVNIKRRDSRRFHAQSQKDSQTCSWLVIIDKMVRNNKPSESSSKLLRSLTFLLDKTHSKSCSRPSFNPVPERTQQELVQEVLSEDKLLMFDHLEESTRLSISSKGSRESAFRSFKSMSETLADEFIAA